MKNNKILIDISYVKDEDLTKSIPLYCKRLIQSLPKDIRDQITLLVHPTFKKTCKALFPDYKTKVLWLFKRGKKTKGVHLILYKISYCFLKHLIKKGHYDVYLNPQDISLYSQDKLPCRKIIVVHDLKSIKKDYLASELQKKYTKSYYHENIKTSDVVVAISSYTKMDILNNFQDIEEGKIKVIYNSVVLANKSVKPKGIDGNKYILYVNTLIPYKNVKTLLQAYSHIKDEIEEKLVVVGRNTEYWNNEMLKFIEQEGLLGRVQRFENITDEELRWLYEHASLFVTTSLHEGFGYTPIEASLCECPVISSRSESLPDVTKELLWYYEPAQDAQELSKAIIKILQAPPSRTKLQKTKEVFSELYSPSKLGADFREILNN